MSGSSSSEPQLVVVGAHGERDRERAVVAVEHAVLEVAEVAADRARSSRVGRRRRAGGRSARGRRCRCPRRRSSRSTPSGRSQRGTAERRPSAATTRSASIVVAVARCTHAGDHGRLAVASSTTRARRRPCRRAASTRAVGQHDAAQHPLEGGAPAGERDQVVVAGPRVAVGHLDGQVVAEAHLGGAGGEQRVEHVGVAVAQQVAQPGQQRVRVAHLRRAPAVPLEGGVGVGRQRRGVALDQRDPVARPATGASAAPSPPRRRRRPLMC